MRAAPDRVRLSRRFMEQPSTSSIYLAYPDEARSLLDLAAPSTWTTLFGVAIYK